MLLDAAGVALFPAGLVVSSQPQGTSLVDWDLVHDGAGGCVLAFTDIRAGGDLDTYAYRLDAAGNQLWGANGVAALTFADVPIALSAPTNLPSDVEQFAVAMEPALPSTSTRWSYP